MWELICQKLIEYFPQVGSYFLIAIVVGIIFWKAGSFYTKTKNISDKLPAIEKSLEKIVNAINEIQIILKTKLKGIDIVNTLVERGNSPLNPTAFGAKLIKDSGLEKILDDNKDLLCTKLKASLPKEYTEYDVQERAREVLLSLKDDPIISPVKTYVYNNPMEIDTILRVGGLWLRDDFLKVPRDIAKEIQ